MASPIYNFSILEKTWEIAPVENDPEAHLDNLSLEKVAELKADYRKHLCSVVANRVAAVSLVILGFPLATAGELITGLLFLPAACFVGFEKAHEFANLPIALLVDMSDHFWNKDGRDHHDYSIPQVRKDALEALRSSSLSFDKDIGYCWKWKSIDLDSKKTKDKYYNFKNLQKVGLITEQDLKILQSLKEMGSLGYIRKKNQFVLQKFPSYVDWSSGSKKNVYLNKQDLAAIEATDLVVNEEEIKEKISSLSEHDIEYRYNLFNSQDGQYNYAISSSTTTLLSRYSAIAAIKKICQEQNLNHIEIPSVKLVEIEIDGKIYTILAQKNHPNCNLDPTHQKDLKPNDQAVSQLLQIMRQIGVDVKSESRTLLDNGNFALLANHIDTYPRHKDNLEWHALNIAFTCNYFFEGKEEAWAAEFNQFPQPIKEYILSDSNLKQYAPNQ